MKKILTLMVCAMLFLTSSFGLAFARDVYVTKKGKKYHVEDCRWIKNRETIKMSEEEAVKKGYKPCSCIKEHEPQDSDEGKE